jgi:hypothetical protein
VSLLTFNSRASLRQDQCVAPSLGLRRHHCNTLACKAAVITDLLNGSVGGAFGQHQEEPGSKDIAGRQDP